MDRRLVIAISGSSAAVVLAVGLTAAGFVPGPRSVAEAETSQAVSEAVAAETSASADTAKPKVVYVKPAPKPKTVVVQRPARVQPASNAQSRSPVARPPRRSAQRGERDSEAREHEAERRKEAREHEREHERDDD